MHQHFKKRKPQAQHWYSQSVGSSLYEINFLVNSQKKSIGADIYIWNNKDLFHHFETHKNEIEQELGYTAEWIEATKACRILISHPGDINKPATWPTSFDWFCMIFLKLKSIAKKYEV